MRKSKRERGSSMVITRLDAVAIFGYNMTTFTERVIRMTQRLSIRPSKDLRTHYALISAEARQNPVAITVNGKEDTVILSHEQYMRQQERIAELNSRLAVYAHLAQAADDVKLGRIQPAEDAFDDILHELRDKAE